MSWTVIRDRVILDGIDEVCRAYEEGDPKREGALEGFAVAMEINDREGFARVLAARQRRELRMRNRHYETLPAAGGGEMAAYWRHRWATLQVEWVQECMKVVWGESPVSARAAIKVRGVYKAMLEEETRRRRARRL